VLPAVKRFRPVPNSVLIVVPSVDNLVLIFSCILVAVGFKPAFILTVAFGGLDYEYEEKTDNRVRDSGYTFIVAFGFNLS
jgi:hypothetical protein